jgi:hypothetical protein
MVSVLSELLSKIFYNKPAYFKNLSIQPIYMNSESKKFFEIKFRLPSSESILYVLIISAVILIFIYIFKPSMVVPTRVKPVYREYVPKYFSNFVFFFYSTLVLHSAFKPIWFVFWPLFFYCLGKRFLKKVRIKYFLPIIGFLFAYAFYAIPNHSIVPLFYLYKPSVFGVNEEFPELCEKKNLMVFAPPEMYLLKSERILDWYVNFKNIYSSYVGNSIYYVCVGNGTVVNVSSVEWNSNELYCPDDVKVGVSGKKYNEILNNPPSLFPMFVFDCNYIVSPYPQAEDRKEWIDIFCFHSGFATMKCFIHLLNPSTGSFLPPEHFL